MYKPTFAYCDHIASACICKLFKMKIGNICGENQVKSKWSCVVITSVKWGLSWYPFHFSFSPKSSLGLNKSESVDDFHYIDILLHFQPYMATSWKF